MDHEDAMCSTKQARATCTPHAAALCQDCSAIDLNLFLDAEINDYYDDRKCKRLLCLDHIMSAESEKCLMCQFFRSVRIEHEVMLALGTRLKVEKWSLYGISTTDLFDLPSDKFEPSGVLAVLPTAKRAIVAEDMRASNVSCQYIIQSTSQGNGICGREIPDKLNPNMVKAWLQACQSSHANLCSLEDISQIPGFQVIDCHSRQIVSWPNLPASSTYVTLSYVWGPQAGSEAGGIKGSLPNEMPQSIEDTMKATELFGFRYLWIDRYCIPQDEPVNKAIQIKNMGKIYGGSVLTLVAAAGKDPSYGLPGVGRTKRDRQPSFMMDSTKLLTTMTQIEQDIARSVWNSRGWTYQEALLSTRRLVFTDTQVYYQCRGMHCHESLNVPLSQLCQTSSTEAEQIDVCRVFPAQTVGGASREIFRRIEEYGQRRLSFQSDALDAITGVLNVFENMCQPIWTLIGVPYNPKPARRLTSLLESLTWELSQTQELSEGKPWFERRVEFPTWTWAGWEIINCRYSFSNLSIDSNSMFLVKPLATLDIIDHMSGQVTTTWQSDSPASNALHLDDRSRHMLRIQAWTLELRITSDGTVQEEHLSSNEGRQIIRQHGQSVHGNQGKYIVSIAQHLGYQTRAEDESFRFMLIFLFEATGGRVGSLILHQVEDGDLFERVQGQQRYHNFGWRLHEILNSAKVPADFQKRTILIR